MRSDCLRRSVLFLRAWLLRVMWLMALGLGFAGAARADLIVSALTDTDGLPAGSVVTYTVELDETSTEARDNVTLRFQFLAGNGRYAGTSGLPSGVVCSGQTLGSPATGTLTCTGISIPAGNNKFTLSIYVRSTIQETLRVQASIDGGTQFETQNTDVLAGADLGVTISLPSGTPAAGSSHSVGFTVINNGPNTSPSSTLTYTVPQGFIVTAAPNICNTFDGGDHYQCYLGSLALGSSTSLSFTGIVAVGNGSQQNHIGYIAAGGGVLDGVASNNTADGSLTISAGTLLTLSKTITGAPSPLKINDSFSYRLSPGYHGDFPANATLSDTLPAQVCVAASTLLTPNNWTCTVDKTCDAVGGGGGPTLNCTRGTANSPGGGAGKYLGDINLSVKALQASASVVNTATLAAPLLQPVSASVSTSVVGDGVDLEALKTKSYPQKAVPKDTKFYYTLSATNRGPNVLPVGAKVNFKDDIPAGLRLDSISPSGSTCDTVVPPGGLVGPFTINCWVSTTSTVGVDRQTPSVTMNVTALTLGTNTNNMCVTLSNVSVTDQVADNDCAKVEIDVQTAKTDLWITKKVSGKGDAASNRQDAGKPILWEMEIGNRGTVTATDVQVTDRFDNVLWSQPRIVTVVPASAGSCTLAKQGGAAYLKDCVIPSLPPCTAGQDCPRILVSVMHYNTGATGTFENANVGFNSTLPGASVLALNQADTDLLNNYSYTNSGKITAYMQASTDLKVTKSATPSTGVAAGTALTYNVTVSIPDDKSPSPSASNVRITDTLPLDVVLLAVPDPGPGGSCSYPDIGTATTLLSRTVQCTWSSVDRGTTKSVLLKVRPLAKLQGTTITNSVTVSSDTPEINTADNTATVSTPVTPPSYDIKVENIDDVDPVAVGEKVTYKLTVYNTKPSTAEGVAVQFRVSSLAGAPTFDSLVTPDGVTCDDASLIASTGIVNCVIATLGGNTTGGGSGTPTGETNSVIIKVVLKANLKGAGYQTFATVGMASPALVQFENTTNNQEDESTAVVDYKADVEVVSKTAMQSGTSTPQSVITPSVTGFDWQVVVRNNGPQQADAVTFKDTLPLNMKFSGTPVFQVTSGSFTPSCSMNGASTVYTCTIASMPAGASATVTMPVQFLAVPPAGNDYTNNAYIITTGSSDTNGGVDPAAGNNFKNHTVQVRSSLVSGYVYHDANRNGLRDGGETGIAGVTVTLTGQTAGNVAITPQTATTNASGYWEFTNLQSGTYTVTENQATAIGYEPGFTRAGSVVNGTPGSVPTSGAGVVTVGGLSTANAIQNIVLNSNGVAGDNLFGEVKRSSLAGRVFLDKDKNGTLGGVDTGIGGVQVRLVGTDFLGGAVDTTTTTTATPNGDFSFPNLLPGTYKLIETTPSGYDDGPETPGTAGGTLTAPDTIEAIALSSDVTATGYYFAETLSGAVISGFVYHDRNGNGGKDAAQPGNAAEAGISGNVLQLTGKLADNTPITPVQTTTANDGSWSFQVEPGTYTVTQLQQPTGYEPGFTVAGTTTGGTSGTVPTTGAGVLVGNGKSTANQIVDIQINGGGSSIGNLFGEVKFSSLAGQVYLDKDANGQLNGGDVGLNGVAVRLQGTDFLGRAVDQTDTTKKVVADGEFRFANLLPGTYKLSEPLQPAGYNDGPEVAGLAGGTLTAPDTIEAIALPSGIDATNYLFSERLQISQADVHVLSKVAKATGTDTNKTTAHPSEAFDWLVKLVNHGPQAAETVQFSDSLPDGMVLAGAPVFTVTNGTFTAACTGAAGGTSVACDIASMPADATATVRIPVRITGSLASGAVLTNTATLVTKGTEDTNGGSDATKGNNFASGSITLQRQRFALSGRVWRDANHDRVYDASETVVGGWTVQLVACNDGSTNCTSSGYTVKATATTAADGTYRMENVEAGKYQLRFVSPQGRIVGGVWPTDPTLNQGANAPVAGMPWINLTDDMPANVTSIVNQDLPLDPGGVVYDSMTAAPVAGATVRFSGPAGFDPAQHLLSGADTMVTDASGEYQFFLLPGAPAGSYTLQVTPPAGYRNSTLFPAAQGALDMRTCTVPGVALSDTDNVDPCLVSPQNRPAAPITAPYVLALLYPGAGGKPQAVVNNHLPLDREGALATLIELRKTSSKLTVKKGEPVPYTITARYTGTSALAGVSLVDTLPPGFKYLDGSLTVQTQPSGAVVPARALLQGRQLTLENLQFAPGESKKVQMVLAVGVGVGEGSYVNSVVARRATVDVSNVATAAVRVMPDALLDCTDVIGKVYDDRNANGWQDEDEPGLPNVRIATVNGLLVNTDALGRYHIACAAVPKEGTGSNLVLKLDERTLPSGYRVTTENPAAERITRGKAVKVNFGATVHRVVRLALQSGAFDGGALTLKAGHEPQLAQALAALRERPSILRLAYEAGADEDAALADARLAAVRELMLQRWKAECQAQGQALFNLDVEVERVPASTTPTRR